MSDTKSGTSIAKLFLYYRVVSKNLSLIVAGTEDLELDGFQDLSLVCQ